MVILYSCIADTIELSESDALHRLKDSHAGGHLGGQLLGRYVGISLTMITSGLSELRVRVIAMCLPCRLPCPV